MKRIRHLSLATALWLALPEQKAAAIVDIDIAVGYLFDEFGTAEQNRLEVDSLCYIVADISGNGFSPLTTDGWTSDDDRIITVSVPEKPGGTLSFDLAHGVTEPGLFFRSLRIDTAQFGNFSDPIPFALLWFPGYKASTTNIGMNGPAEGTHYGLFTRKVPVYNQPGISGWFIPNVPSAKITVDPFATSELDGTDPSTDGLASHVVKAIPEPASMASILAGGFLICFGRRRRASVSGSKP